MALVAFSGRTAGSGWAFRAANIYAWAAAVTYAVLGAMWSARGDGVQSSAIVGRALVWISWAGGVAAWVTARRVEADEARLGLNELAALHGASPRAFFVARVVATMTLVARAVAFPGVLLCVLLPALTRAPEGAAAGVLLAVRVVIYAMVFGAVFGGLARLSSQLSPRHGRLLFVALVIGPEVMRGVFGDLPSLVSGFGELIELLVGPGGVAA